MKDKKQTPKNLYVRLIDDGKKFSVGEYIRAKWRNAVDPFKIDDKMAMARLSRDMNLFKLREKREVVLVNYRGSGPAEQLSAEMDKL